LNNSSARKAPPSSRSIRNVLLNIPNFSRSIDESTYSSTIIICFGILNFLLDPIMNILGFQERFLVTLSKDFVGGLLFQDLAETM